MASRSSRQGLREIQMIDKLVGKENYRSWSIAMTAYLQHEELWDTIVAPTNGNLSTDEEKLTKARCKIILAVDPVAMWRLVDSGVAPKLLIGCSGAEFSICNISASNMKMTHHADDVLCKYVLLRKAVNTVWNSV
ncbi:hypothetical protein QAD02_014030 [Eretmocerus hayati]|uniref:Uncharacterized protein n=1 Tax=Eretmocerus hayati TaxID=131215 RepID=A0ACC2P553_9HYME|nr:hypothetical protein QAD02_014030 [Eretmocerus hayati]